MTLRMVEVTSAVEASDAFLYSGYKTCSFKVLPLASHVLKFTLLPLTGGNCLLPRLKLREASAVANSTSSSSAAVAANGTLPSTTSPSDASVIKKGDREGSASSTTAANTTTTTTASDTVLKINYSWDDLTVFVRPRIEE